MAVRFLQAICIVLMMLPPAAGAQTNLRIIHLEFNGRRPPVTGTIPFNAVQVLDNLDATTCFYAVQDGAPVPGIIEFSRPVPEEIQQYLQQAIASIPHGTDTLLINLRQCRISNKKVETVLYRKRKIRHVIRRSLLVTADLYCKKDNGFYYPIATVKKACAVQADISYTVALVLNDMLRVAGGHAPWDATGFRYPEAFDGVTLEQINTTAPGDEWQNTVAASPLADGVYRRFIDFQLRLPVKEHVHLLYSAKDSLYRLMPGKNGEGIKGPMPWGIADSGSLYINVLGNMYAKAIPYRNSFLFYIPRSLPDMYSLLCRETKSGGNGFDAIPASVDAPLLAYLAVVAVEITVDVIIESSAQRRIKRMGMQSGYRYCRLDMNNGDIIYAKTIQAL